MCGSVREKQSVEVSTGMARQESCDLIDLSYLTDTEKSTILAVVKRDISLNRETQWYEII